MATTLDRKAVGLRLHMLRYEKGWTLRELAAETGISESMLSRYERGTHPMKDEQLMALAQVFGTSPDELLGFRLTPSSLSHAA